MTAPVIVFLLVFVAPLVIGLSVMGVVFSLRNPWYFCKSHGLTVNAQLSLRPALKNVKRQLDIMLPIFVSNFGQVLGGEDRIRNFLSCVRCDLINGHLKTNLRSDYNPDKLIGLTHSPERIEVSCHDYKYFRNEDGLVLIQNTAFLYELLNALLWAFASYSLAYAESFIDPAKKEHWRWVGDATGDGHVNAADVEFWKSERAKFDERLQVVKRTARSALKQRGLG